MLEKSAQRLAIALATGILVIGSACQPQSAAPAGEAALRTVHVMSSGGFREAYDALAPQFEAATGIHLETAYGSSSGDAPNSIPSRLARGEAADLIILSRPSLDSLTERGDVDSDSRTDLADSILGLVVKSGAPRPDISTPEAFVATLLAASSIGYSTSMSGKYLSTDLFPRLGIWDQLQSKSGPVDDIGVSVAIGDIEIGIQQTSALLGVDGVDYVGPIPDEYQNPSTFSAGLITRAGNPDDARQLLEFLSSEEAANTIVTAAPGLRPAVWRGR